jgi:hypothetical protein
MEINKKQVCLATGAGSGIGKEFAVGFVNLVLM